MVSLQDVADAAGVSIATASRALGSGKRVSEESARRVRAAAERLGYRVNFLGKALREGSDAVVGIVIPMISNPFYASLVHEFEDQLERTGLKLLIADSHGELEREVDRLEALVSRRVRGIFVAPAYFDRSRETIVDVARQVPLVQIDRRVEDDAALSFVGVDNAAGIDQVVDHLADCGAEDVVFVGADNRTSGGRERAAAFEAAALRRGLHIHAPVIDRYLFEFGVYAAELLIARGDLPGAVVAGDDLIAAGLLSGFASHRIRVPDDVMVTGFDGTLLADICSPRLTTMEQPMAAIAEAAVTEIRRKIGGDTGAPADVRLPTTLRIGGSTRFRSR